MGIKIGNIDASYFKVGSGDCSIYLGTTLLYSGGTPPAPHDYSKDYLTFRALEDGDISWNDSSTSNTLSYSTDNGTTWSSPSASFTVSVNSGDTVLFKGECIPSASNPYGIGRFSGTTADFDLEGNIMSLLYGDNFSGKTSLSGNTYTFFNLFRACATLQSAENLSLPAETLIYGCYYFMFRDCTSLTTAPSLPATALATNCYYGMFQGCSNLTTAPSLLATTLAEDCYEQMFSYCTSLTTAPELPATTLAYDCYQQMFRNCTSLTTAPELPATTLAYDCYQQMFRNCTSLTTAPTLLATTLKSGCYNGMFNGCSSLSSITCLATNISASQSLTNWVNGVASTGTFTTPSSTNWSTGTNGIPNGWTRVDYQEN